MVDDLDSPSAGVSSLSSTRTLPVRNCPGKYRRFVLSKRIKNLTSFLVMLTVTVHKARADVTDSRSHSCPLRALTDSPATATGCRADLSVPTKEWVGSESTQVSDGRSVGGR